jgi:hypothetical protein
LLTKPAASSVPSLKDLLAENEQLRKTIAELKSKLPG